MLDNTSSVRRMGLMTVAFLCLFGATAQGAQTGQLKVVQRLRMPLGNEIEFFGSRVYVNQYGSEPGMGVRSFEITPKGLRETGRLPCSGITDVAAVSRAVIAIGLQRGGEECNAPPAPVEGYAGGVHVADVRDPSRPHLLGHIAVPGGVHTLTAFPGEPYVYASVGGADAYAAFGGKETIVDVSHPDHPVIAATYKSALNPAGCHDVLFQEIKGKLYGFCPGLGGTEIWDVSDPLVPVAIGRMALPFGQLPHRVAVTSDGAMAAVSDEAYGAHACAGGGPLGALWFYDITDLTAPTLLGYYGPQRGTLPVGSLSGNSVSCTAHNFNFVPGSRLLVAAWISGGTNVLDVSDPTAIEEVAYYRPDDAITMSSYWYRGHIYSADFNRGVEVLDLENSH